MRKNIKNESTESQEAVMENRVRLTFENVSSVLTDAC